MAGGAGGLPLTTSFPQWLLWSAAGLLVYAYVVYPVLVIAVARLVGRSPERESPTPTDRGLPTVAVVVAAFNEETSIAARIENLLQQDYPLDRLHILIGCDGCTDGTVETARQHAGEHVTVHAFPQNRGKSSVLNDLVAAADAAIVVFTDANTVFRPDTVRRLVGAFDNDTAAVCGELIMQRASAGTNQDHQYWTVERRLKRAESSIGGLLGANGGVYAIRRECFQPLRPDTICDDFVIAMNIAVGGGGLRYVPSATAYEDVPEDVEAEFHRRTRIGTGNYQALFRHPRYIFGGSFALAFTYLSHKVLRWFTPHLAIIVLAGCLLSDVPAYRVFGALQFAGLMLAWIVHVTRHRVVWPNVFRFASYFAVLNVAFLVGFSSFLTGNYRGSWRRTAR